MMSIWPPSWNTLPSIKVCLFMKVIFINILNNRNNLRHWLWSGRPLLDHRPKAQLAISEIQNDFGVRFGDVPERRVAQCDSNCARECDQRSWCLLLLQWIQDPCGRGTISHHGPKRTIHSGRHRSASGNIRPKIQPTNPLEFSLLLTKFIVTNSPHMFLCK